MITAGQPTALLREIEFVLFWIFALHAGALGSIDEGEN